MYWIRNSYITWLRDHDPEWLLEMLRDGSLGSHLDDIAERAIRHEKRYLDEGFDTSQAWELVQESLMPSDRPSLELEWDQEDRLNAELEPLLASFREQQDEANPEEEDEKTIQPDRRVLPTIGEVLDEWKRQGFVPTHIELKCPDGEVLRIPRNPESSS
jgi:hypothetical protein